MEKVSHGAVPRVVQPGPAAIGLAALAVFVLYGSSGALVGDLPRAAPLPGMSLPDLAQNLLLYIPFGTLGVWALRRSRPPEPALLVRVVAIAFVYSIAMELLQMLSATRIASPVDVIANVLGACTGAMAAERADRALASAVERVRPTGLLDAPARYALTAVLAAIVVAAWYPFDVTLDISTLSDRTRAVRLDPWLWPGTAELWEQGARFFVLAGVLVASLPGLAWRAAPVAAVAAAAAAMVTDLGQLAMGSQPIGGAALLSQAAGGCAGAGAAFVVTFARGTWYAAA
jgi:VanZ family protein